MIFQNKIRFILIIVCIQLQILHYRVKILDIRELPIECDNNVVALIPSDNNVEEPSTPCKSITEDDLLINEWTNHKMIPEENIIKRKSTDLSRMIATIEEEFTDSDNETRKATVNTNGPVTVHAHQSNQSAVYSVCETKKDADDDKVSLNDHQQKERKNSKTNFLNDINGGYDSVKRMFQKTMSVDRSANKIQKPPRKFLTLNNRKSRNSTGEFDDPHDETMSLKVRRSGSTGDLSADTYSLPDKIPTTPPPKKNGKKSNSFINLMRSNLKF